MKPLLLTFTIALMLAALADGATTPTRATYPSSVAVLGGGDAAGYASDPKRPFQEARANSWATGSNPAVRSIYTRLLTANPAVRGRASNFSSHGATVRDLPSQVRKAGTLRTKPDLVLVQFVHNDAPCDGKDEPRYADYQARVTEALQKLASGLPNARILAVSEWGTLGSYIKAVSSYGLGARLMHASKGLCSIFAPKTGKVVPAHVAYLRRTSNGYNAAFAAACKEVATCRYDGDAARRIVLRPADLAHRYESLSIQGLAKLAAAEWRVLYGG
jgi:hypothetical protein